MPAPRPIASVDVPVAATVFADVLGVMDIALVDGVVVALIEDDVAFETALDEGSIVPTGNMEP
jgi:hypothetical protein